MENELKKLAAAMHDMSDMVGDHHWRAAKAIEELGVLKSKPINIGDLDPQQRLVVARGDGEFGDAYQGAREDLSIWKRRALEAEAKVREQDQIIENLGNALNADNGPTFMGEPVLRAAASVGGERNREEDRAVFTDPLFNKWLDEPITENGEYSVWDQVGDTCAAWHGWENRQFYVDQEYAELRARAALSPAADQYRLDVARALDLTGDHEWPSLLVAIKTAAKLAQSDALSPAGGGVVLRDVTEALRRFMNRFGCGETRDIQALNAADDALARLNAKPHCATCNDNGRIGGPSFYAPDEGGDPCPDCAKPQANSQEAKP